MASNWFGKIARNVSHVERKLLNKNYQEALRRIKEVRESGATELCLYDLRTARLARNDSPRYLVHNVGRWFVVD